MRRILGIVLLLIAVASSPDAFAKSKAPIRIAVTDDLQQVVMARITGAALKKAGFKIEFVDVAAGEVIEGLSSGDLHAEPRYLLRKDAAYGTALENGSIRRLGGLSGNRPDDPVQKLVWAGMKKKWPYAQKMLKTIIFPNAELEALAAKAERDGVDPVVAAWMKDNRKRWKRWVTASTNWMKP